ncbi:MAG: hypothetical protein JO051_11845 [Acidobacteriaceae bacterium]|nr:hypothetical protein [Acidobacteriaceae bacterium]
MIHAFGFWMPVLCAALLPFIGGAQDTEPAQSKLAIVQAGVQASEDAPFASAGYEFLPGDYVYFTFQITGFSIQSLNRDEVRKISLTYQVTPQDAHGTPLVEPVSDSIQAEISAEDKNWTPKRRVPFLLPSYISSGDFHIHLIAKDVAGKTEVARDYPFHIGGVSIAASDSINVQHFEFLRRENDRDALDVPAYSPGDTVFARFDMAGFKLASGNTYELEYGLTVIQPSGKLFLDAPRAAELKSTSFYPAQYLPGVIRISTPANSAKGEYILTLVVRDLVGNAKYEMKKSFSIE